MERDAEVRERQEMIAHIALLLDTLPNLLERFFADAGDL